jgi:hypothetical protein
MLTTTKRAKRFASSSSYSMSRTALTWTPHPATWVLLRSRMPEGAIGMIICSCNVISDHDVRDAVESADIELCSTAQVYNCLGHLD